MTSLAQQFRTGLDKLARIVGHVIIRLVLIVIAAGIMVSLGNAMGMGGDASGPVAAPAAAAPAAGPVVGTSGTAEHQGAAPAAPAAATPMAASELAHTAGGLVAVHSHDVTGATWVALVEAGAVGDQGDGTDDVIYATPQIMLDAVDDLGSR